jgi:hypothetical protein
MSFLFRKGGRPDDALDLPYDPRSPEGLAARWVRWVASVGPLKNPVLDDTGERAAVNQPDDVWFLAGSDGRRVERRCAVPMGRELFLPAFNMWHRHAEEPPESMDRAHGSVVLDGVKHEPEVIATPVPFLVTGAGLNGVTMRKRPTPVTVWGLWTLLPGLELGPHELRVVGGDGYGFEVDVTYRLDVVVPPPAYPPASSIAT